MATTKRILAERIQRILAGGNPSSRDRVLLEEIYQHIGSLGAKALKMQYYEVAQGIDGNSLPVSAMVATFEGLSLEPVSGFKCRFKLPAAPMTLPEGIGVMSVFADGLPEKEYFPIPAVNINIWLNEKLCNPINTGIYTVDNKYVTIYDDLLGMGVKTATAVLCIMDIDSFEEDDVLPFSADLEDDIMRGVLEIYGAEPRTDRSETKVPNPAKTDG